MTIAVCYLSPEGVVLGADSTTTVGGGADAHFFNHAQKLFEIGSNSTLALVTWGLAGFGTVSHRTNVALLADDLAANPPGSVLDVATRFRDLVWPLFDAIPEVNLVRQLHAKAKRTPAEEEQYVQLKAVLVLGFCIAGHCLPDRVSTACEIVFDPIGGKPNPVGFQPNTHKWYGVPNMIARLIFGCDENLKKAILSSGKWSGSEVDLQQIINSQTLSHPILPIRDAIDFVHSCIRSTGKALKFSNFSQVCGGSPEIAVITTDRAFRWVRHKSWDTAIVDGG